MPDNNSLVTLWVGRLHLYVIGGISNLGSIFSRNRGLNVSHRNSFCLRLCDGGAES